MNADKSTNPINKSKIKPKIKVALPVNLKILLQGFKALFFGIIFASTFYYLPAIGLMVLFPMVWLSWPNRKYCALFILSFYLSMNWEEIPDGLKFFESSHIGISSALLIWLAHSTFMSLPWILAYTNERNLKILLGRTILLTTLLFVPPLGYFIWLQPITTAGILFPGWDWLGFSLTIMAMLLLVALSVRTKKALVVLICLIGVLSLSANLTYNHPHLPKTWVAVDTNFGPAPNNYFSLAYREFSLIDIVQQALDQNYKIILLPENVAVDWLPGTQDQWQAISREAQSKGATVIVGAQLDHPDRSFDNALVILGKDGGRYLLARQPMPLGLWRPWSKTNYHAHWFDTGNFNLQGYKVAYLICYEQMVPWPALSSFMTWHKPIAIISSANQWFSTPSGYSKQHNVMLANARLFSVPTLTALNT